jgi:hypothetical protein
MEHMYFYMKHLNNIMGMPAHSLKGEKNSREIFWHIPLSSEKN